ncbi:MAG: GtrA family protein [Synergistaceae bacterium]|nr:GtrA family protein [Synergistaceae bacterium]
MTVAIMETVSETRSKMTEKKCRFGRREFYKKFRIPDRVQRICDVIFMPEVISYLFFGALTTLVNVAVYWAAVNLFHIAYQLATVIAWILSVTFAFVTNKFIVFKSKSVELAQLLKEAASFVVARMFSGGADLLWMVFAVEVFGMDDFISKIISNVFVVILNYIFSKLFIFKKTEESENAKSRE